MKRLIVFITFLVLLAGCDKGLKASRLLTDDNHKFWDFYRNEYKAAFYFHKDGRFYTYNYNYKGIRHQFHLDDVMVSDSWFLIANDSIVINGDAYKILQLTEDSLKLIHNGIWNDSISCFKSPNQTFEN